LKNVIRPGNGPASQAVDANSRGKTPSISSYTVFLPQALQVVLWTERYVPHCSFIVINSDSPDRDLILNLFSNVRDLPLPRKIDIRSKQSYVTAPSLVPVCLSVIYRHNLS
jgi:hypothetical protein